MEPYATTKQCSSSQTLSHEFKYHKEHTGVIRTGAAHGLIPPRALRQSLHARRPELGSSCSFGHLPHY